MRSAWLLLAALSGSAAGCSEPDRDTPHVPSNAGQSRGGSGSSAGAAAGSTSGATSNTGGVNQGGAGAAAGANAAGMAGDACPATSTEPQAWPGPAEVMTLEDPALFNGNLSGLTYEPVEGAPRGVLWAVANIPGKLYRLLPNGAGYVADPSNGWVTGKLLHYPDGADEPDAEGVTLGATSADGLYVVAEHDNEVSGTSRLSVLRYEIDSSDAELTATHEWNLTSLLPPLGANTGLEAITWVPDGLLTSRGFVDESSDKPYEPEGADHGGGVFFVGAEQNGMVYGFVLDHATEEATLVATWATPSAGVMGLEHDRDSDLLWAWCDETCGNVASLFEVETRVGAPNQGRFVLRRRLERPSGLPNSNHEGIAIAPDSECSGGLKPFFWLDDADASGQSLRQGSVRCGTCL